MAPVASGFMRYPATAGGFGEVIMALGRIIPDDERIVCVGYHAPLINPTPERNRGYIPKRFTLPDFSRQEYIIDHQSGSIVGIRISIEPVTTIYIYGRTGYYGSGSGDVTITIGCLGIDQSFVVGKVSKIARKASPPTIAGIEIVKV